MPGPDWVEGGCGAVRTARDLGEAQAGSSVSSHPGGAAPEAQVRRGPGPGVSLRRSRDGLAEMLCCHLAEGPRGRKATPDCALPGTDSHSTCVEGFATLKGTFGLRIELVLSLTHFLVHGTHVSVPARF